MILSDTANDGTTASIPNRARILSNNTMIIPATHGAGSIKVRDTNSNNGKYKDYTVTVGSNSQSTQGSTTMNKYRVCYNANIPDLAQDITPQNYTDIIPGPQDVRQGDYIVLPTIEISYTYQAKRYKLVSWKDNQVNNVTYQAGQTIQVTSDMSFLAQYEIDNTSISSEASLCGTWTCIGQKQESNTTNGAGSTIMLEADGNCDIVIMLDGTRYAHGIGSWQNTSDSLCLYVPNLWTSETTFPISIDDGTMTIYQIKTDSRGRPTVNGAYRVGIWLGCPSETYWTKQNQTGSGSAGGSSGTTGSDDSSSKEHDFIDDAIQGINYEILPDDTIKIKSTTNKHATSLSIPEKINGKKVTVIGQSAFANCYSLKTLDLPMSITEIEDYAFSNCTNLEYAYISDKVTSIGKRAFYWCTELWPIEIGESVKIIKEEAFSNCTSVKELIIPGNVETIEKDAFSTCTSLAKLTVKDGVKTIGENAFYHCIKLTDVDIADSVTDIGKSAFCECTSLKNLKLSNSLTALKEMVFKQCSELEAITIPDSVTTIEAAAFVYCNKIKHIAIPSSVTNICKGALDVDISMITVDENNKMYCAYENVLYNKDKTVLIKYLRAKPGTLFVIPDSVKEIKPNAFSYAKNLTLLYIPVSVEKIDIQSCTESPFYECNEHLRIQCQGASAPIGFKEHWNARDYYGSECSVSFSCKKP